MRVRMKKSQKGSGKMKMKIRFLSAWLMVFILVTMLPAGVVWADDEIYAQLYVDETVQLTNMQANTTQMTYTERDGRKGLISHRSNSNAFYILVNVSDKLIYDLPEYTAVEVTVEYFDEGNGFISFAYDSYNPNSKFYIGNDRWNNGELVHLEDTKTWKSYTWYLEDAKFTNRCDGYDVRVGIWEPGRGTSPDDVVFGSVTVKRAEFRNPLSNDGLSSKINIGNIFSAEDAVNLELPIMNKSEKKVNAEYDIKVTDSNGNVIETIQVADSYDARQKKDTPVQLKNPGIYGIYDVEIVAKATYEDEPENGFSEVYSSQFSVSHLPGREGIRNPYYGVCQQVIGYGWGDMDTTPYLVNNLGMSYMRDECLWKDVEKQKGALQLPEGVKEKYQAVKDLGIEPLLILCYTNPHYDNNRTPASDEAIAAYANYCAFMASELKGIINYYEIWNEYNIASFNKSNEPPETYAKMLKAAYTAIKKVNPEATVIGIDIAGIGTDWPRRVFEAGGYEYCDAVSCHPYDWSGEFREQVLIKDGLAFKELLREFGEEKPIWYTEMGFSTYVGGNGRGYTREEQCAATVLMNAVNRAYDLCDVYTQYCFHDQDEDETSESCWGLVNSWHDNDDVDNGAKESYLAAGAMNHFWGNAEYKSKITDDDNRQYAFNFYNATLGKNVLLLQSGSGSSLKTINLGCSSVEIYDMYGNYQETIHSDNGVYGFQIKDIPSYVLGNFNNFAETSEKPAIEIDSDKKQVAVGETVTYLFTNNTDKKLEIELKDEGMLEVVKNNGFEGNRAEVTLQTPADALDDFSFSIYFRDENGNVYQTIQPQVTTVHPVGVTITSEQATENGTTHWRARAVVENLTTTLTIGGKVSVAAPDDMAAIAEDKIFTSMAPGEKTTFLFNIPERVNKKPVELTLRVALNNGYVREVTTLLDFGLCYYTDKKPTVDGKVGVGEWTGSWIGADEKKDVREDPNWGGPSDLSFSGTMMWDEENFYLLSIVTDDAMSVKYDPPRVDNMWRGDMVQFGLDDRVEVNSAQLSNFCDIGLARVDGTGDVAYRFGTFYDHPVSVIIENCELAVEHYGTYTVYELAIPFAEIFEEGYKIDTEKTYRFSILANDNDTGTRKGWIEYTSGIGTVKNVEQFGSLRFVK